MTTLMWWGNSDGVKGRCNASCHGAKGLYCDCMCAGRYHGKGVDSPALYEAVKEHGDEVVAKANAKAKEQGLSVHFADIQQVFGFVSQVLPSGSLRS